MTGGRVKRIEKYIDQDDDLFMLTYGDGVGDVNIRAAAWSSTRAMGNWPPSRPSRPVPASESSRRTRQAASRSFKEKAKTSGRASAGFFVLDRRVFDYLGGDDCIFEKEPLERLADEGQLMAYQHDGFFYAMDTYREYEYLNQLWSANQAPWKVWQE